MVLCDYGRSDAVLEKGIFGNNLAREPGTGLIRKSSPTAPCPLQVGCRFFIYKKAVHNMEYGAKETNC